MTMSKVSGNDV